MKIVASKEEQYQKWIKNNPLKKFTQRQKDEQDFKLEKEIEKELRFLDKLTIEEYNLTLKWEEVNDYCKNLEAKNNYGLVKRAKDKMWKVQGRSDFRKIQPELILITDDSDDFEIEETNYFGEKKFSTYENNEDNKELWECYRVLIASHAHSGVIGRSLKYMVRDKITQSYLGIICIAGSFHNLTVTNPYLFFDKTKELSNRNRDLSWHYYDLAPTHCGIGQTIIPTQPFGYTFNGGKLLALLCLSDQVQKDWKRRYRNPLVSMETTALYGEKKQSQYDGLRPYWNAVGNTSGNTTLLPRKSVEEKMMQWHRLRFPQDHFSAMVYKLPNGQDAKREKRGYIIEKVYKYFAKNNKQIKTYKREGSGYQRKGYVSPLYVNTREFLLNQITENELIRNYDYSVKTLTDFWKFGYKGDSRKEKPNQKIMRMIKSDYKRKSSLESQSTAKTRLNYTVDKLRQVRIVNKISWHEKMYKESKQKVFDLYADKLKEGRL
ncbi:MAG: hypothetical protein CMP38_04935 [Rickettsiales bacterium]|nr:hypothetical protein [Rickettsiales bacterium]OUW02608.1 MAG: hypothetical protein CBD16_04020 [Betaproteobacteria bacterium TMED156]